MLFCFFGPRANNLQKRDFSPCTRNFGPKAKSSRKEILAYDKKFWTILALQEMSMKRIFNPWAMTKKFWAFFALEQGSRST